MDSDVDVDVLLSIDLKRNHTSKFKGGSEHRIACSSKEEATDLVIGIHNYIRNVFPEIRRCRLVAGMSEKSPKVKEFRINTYYRIAVYKVVQNQHDCKIDVFFSSGLDPIISIPSVNGFLAPLIYVLKQL